MRIHPALLMVLVWTVCIAAFYLLPFQLVGRTMTTYGFLVLALFIGTFCIGALIRPRFARISAPSGPVTAPDLTWTDRVLMGVIGFALIMMMIEFYNGEYLELSDSYESRSARAQALLYAQESESTIYFQLAFLTYPAAFVWLIRDIVFRPRFNVVTLGIFGLLPITLASLVMGGRGPLLYGLVILMIGYGARRAYRERAALPKRRRLTVRQFAILASGAVMMLVAMNYFVEVFIVRASAAGGVDQMMMLAAIVWGVDFQGYGANTVRAVIGDGNTYLIFVFIWYLVQGLVMSNIIFTDFSGDPSLGIYGIDLASAVMRRVDGSFVAERFTALLDLNVYGFLPSAFGSVYVDFLWFGLLPIFAWGYFTSYTYWKVRSSDDARWFLFAPLVTSGIVFSLINTPIGFGNGFIIHIWFAVALIFARNPGARRPAAPALA
ncbi:MAG: hypothetical protein WA918_05130 [Erythrobacter sp.]